MKINMAEIKAELSKKNECYLPKHRYYELKHFCFQYPEWVKIYNSLTGLSTYPREIHVNERRNGHSDPTAKVAEKKAELGDKIEMVNTIAKSIAPDMYFPLIKGITEKLNYEQLCMNYDVICSRDAYYKLYRQFFWALDKVRG